MNKSEYVTHTQLANEVKRLESIIETLRERNRMLYKKLQNAIDTRKYYYSKTRPKRQELTAKMAAKLAIQEIRKEGIHVPPPTKGNPQKPAQAGARNRPHIDWTDIHHAGSGSHERHPRPIVGCRPKE